MKNILAYTAGYIDGDGCFYIGKNAKPIKYRNGIIVSSTNKEVLYFFKKNFSGRVSHGNENMRFKTYNPIHHWTIQGINANKLAINLLPYLLEKRTDAEHFIKFTNTTSKNIKQFLIDSIKIHRNTQNLVTKDIITEINSVPYIGVNSEEDYAYLSGFIDAECSLGISKYKPKNRPNITYKVLLQCNNTKTSIFYWLRSKFGGSCYFVSRRAKNPKHKDQICWRLSAKALSKILPFILPYLKYKKPVCEALIEFYKTTLDNGGDRQKDHPLSYPVILQRREELCNKIHILNSKTNIHI